MARLSGLRWSWPPSSSPAAPAGPRPPRTSPSNASRGTARGPGGGRCHGSRNGSARTITARVRRTAAGLALALAALVAVPVLPGLGGAADAATLVSNINKTGTQAFTVNASALAQSFRAGSVADLDSVRLRFERRPRTLGNFSVELWSNGSNDRPNSKLADFTNPGSISDNSNATFDAPDNTQLTAERTYWIVVSYDKPSEEASNQTPRLQATDSDGEDSGSVTGWSVGNGHFSRARATTGAWSSGITTQSNTNALRIRVDGERGPQLAGALVATTGQLVAVAVDQNIDADNLPDKSAFTVTVGTTNVTIGTVGTAMRRRPAYMPMPRDR